MINSSYAHYLKTTQLIISGINKNLEALQEVNITNETAEELQKNYDALIQLENEQESLKAQLKTKTKELYTKLEETDKLLKKSKKLIKIQIPKSKWLEFGIADKK